MITNTRLMELRTTGLECQKSINKRPRQATQLEKDYAELYQLVCDGLGTEFGMGVHSAFLFGK